MTYVIDPDSDSARLARHRGLFNMGLPPHPDVVRRQEMPLEAALLVAKAIDEINRLPNVAEAEKAIKLLKQVWSLLDPEKIAPKELERKKVSPDVPARAYLHKTSADCVSSDPTAYSDHRVLVEWNDVADKIDWLEEGLQEWRAYALGRLPIEDLQMAQKIQHSMVER